MPKYPTATYQRQEIAEAIDVVAKPYGCFPASPRSFAVALASALGEGAGFLNAMDIGRMAGAMFFVVYGGDSFDGSGLVDNPLVKFAGEGGDRSFQMMDAATPCPADDHTIFGLPLDVDATARALSAALDAAKARAVT